MPETMKRNGKALKQLPDGAKRRMPDGKNAFRKMSHAQRIEYISWIAAEFGESKGISPGVWLEENSFCLISYVKEPS